ncbi:hypothetical protein FRC12_006868 [Ceratobasidium sp. 428]|nr:hypothetical protein FRC12_006868 [Ceratobasidium sp. 428]
MPLALTNSSYSRKKKFSISAGLEYASNVLAAGGTRIYRRSTGSPNLSQPSTQDVTRYQQLVTDNLGYPSNSRSRDFDSLPARYGQRKRASWYGVFNREGPVVVQPIRPLSLALVDSIVRQPGDFSATNTTDGGQISWPLQNTMDPVPGDSSPAASFTRDDSLSMIQASLSEAHCSRERQGGTSSPVGTASLSKAASRVSVFTANSYATAGELPVTSSSLLSISLSLSGTTASIVPTTSAVLAAVNVPRLKSVKRQTGGPRGWEIPVASLRQCWQASRICEMTVARMEWYGSEAGTDHFMLFQLVFSPKLRKKEIWMRLERCTAHSILKSAAGRPKSLVDRHLDIAVVSSNKYGLLGSKNESSHLKTIEEPIPFSSILDVLDLVRKNSPSDTQTNGGRLFASFVMDEICWFCEHTSPYGTMMDRKP